MEDLVNRIAKSYRHRQRWARRQGLSAFRIFDRDIPEHRCTVDVYGEYAVVIAFPSNHPRAAARQLGPEELREAVARGMDTTTDKVFVKVRRPSARREAQYEREASQEVETIVEEGGLRFRVNLSDYADTGLFLDHRNTRAMVRAQAAGKRFLNLFCYTGAFTVHAAAGGASSTTSVDLSNTYLGRLEENLRLNDLWGRQHEIVRSDVVRWLRQARERPAARFDLAVLDPPSFSTSKKMEQSFEIQRDHPGLLADTLALLSPGGVLYFSTNFRGFSPEWEAVAEEARALGSKAPSDIEELTPGSIPEDFRDKAAHRCFRLRAR
jgi:23S rRNA (cytosine1962-C5)-methyltransferase